MLVPGIKVGRCRKMALSKFVGERMTRPVRIALLDIHIFIQVSARSAIALQGHRLARPSPCMLGEGRRGAQGGGGARYVPWHEAYQVCSSALNMRVYGRKKVML